MKNTHIIFDLDGTLVDSEAIHYEGWKKALATFGATITDYETYMKTYAGIPTAANAQTFIKTHHMDTTVAELSALREDLFHEIFAQHKPVFVPHALEMLNYLKAHNYPMYLVTGSPRETVDILFQNSDLGSYFNFSITSSDVTHSKPHPESYLKAIDKIDADPSQMLVFEDTFSGLTAAKDAGLRCYGINHDTELRARLQKADATFENLSDARAFLIEKGILQ